MNKFNTYIENSMLKSKIKKLENEIERLKFELHKEKSEKGTEDFTYEKVYYGNFIVKKSKIKPKPIEKK